MYVMHLVDIFGWSHPTLKFSVKSETFYINYKLLESSVYQASLTGSYSDKVRTMSSVVENNLNITIVMDKLTVRA